MISAEEARTFFNPNEKEIEEHTQGRVNEILNIINSAIEGVYKNNKKVIIPVKLGDSSYLIVVNQNILYIGEGHEVLNRVFKTLKNLGFEVGISSKTSTSISSFEVHGEVYETLTISWE